MHVSYPLTSRKEFAVEFERAFLEQGEALVGAVIGDQSTGGTTVTTATADVSNDGVRSYVMNSASGQTLTVGADLDKVAVGEIITVTVSGAGDTTVAAGSGVTLNVKTGNTLVSDGQYSVIRITKTAANAYVVSGDLATA